MTEKTDPHPLLPWLAKKGITLFEFVKTASIKNFNKIYENVRGEVSDPRLSTLHAIEDATDKKVSVQKQSDWFRSRK